MRVLLISHGAGPYGAERILLELARRLSGRGDEVVVAFPHEGPATDMASAVPNIEIHVDGRRRLPRGVREGMAYFLGGPADVIRMRTLVRRVDPDVTWVNSMYNAWAALGARLAPSPVVWQMHERSLPEPAGAAVAAIAGWTTERCVVVSEFVGAGFRRFPWLRRRVRVLHNPLLHAPAPEPPRPEEPFTIGYVGQLEPRKRVVDLVHALSLLPEDVRGVIVGDGKARHMVEAEVRRHDVERRVELTGYRDDVAAQMGRFHCLVMPSVNEPFGLVVLDAMALGVPVIAARSGALPELLGDAGLFFEPRDPEDLARQVARLRSDRALRARLASRGVERAASFDPERWTTAVSEILADVARARPPHEAPRR